MMVHRSPVYIVVITVLVTLLIGCGPVPIYEQSYPIDENGWTYVDSIDFAFTVDNNDLSYNILLDVQHSTAFSFSNLYINIATVFADGKRKEQPVSLQLTDATSSWLGDCDSDYCLLTIPIVEDRKFRAVGDYQLVIRQHSRKQALAGIKGISLSVVPTQ